MIVEKGTYKVIKGKGILETESLGSCIGMAVLDKDSRIGGIWVFVLPARKILSKAQDRWEAAFFALEGLDIFLEALKKEGTNLEAVDIILAGGARFLEAPTVFDLGGLNISMIKKLFKDKGLLTYKEHLGNPFPVKLYLDVWKKEIILKTIEEA